MCYSLNMETKECTHCHKTFPADLENFHRAKLGKLGLVSWCKGCVSEYARKWRLGVPKEKLQAANKRNSDWRKAHPDVAHLNSRRYHLKKKGITPAIFDARMLGQGGRCACCGDVAKLVVDHDHSTGDFRGLICNHCNMGLGQFKDSVARLQSAVEYLNKYKATRSPD